MPIAQSSHMDAYEFDPESQTLTVQFQNGSIYQVHSTENDYWAFHQSSSKGSYWHAKFKSSARKIQGGKNGRQTNRRGRGSKGYY